MRFVRQILGRLARDEKGTALTEFVITLPIFVLTFVFIVSFHKHTTELNRIRYRAATNMWGEAMQIQRDGAFPPTSPHGLPIMAAPAALGIIGGSPSFAGDTAQMGIVGGMATGRSGREMQAGSLVTGAMGSDPATQTSLTFAKGIAEDGQFSPLPAASNSPVAIFNFAIIRTVTNTRHAGIIGTRYGAVEGQSSGLVDANGWGSYTFEAQYDVLVSPVSIPSGDEMWVVGASRLLADDDPCLQTVLELSTSRSDC